MNSSTPPNGSINEFSSSSGVDIDIKRILFQALRYWYVIALSLVIALTAAFLRNRYSVRIYPVTASILFKEKQEASQGNLLYNNPLVSGFRNYENELYIIRSYPLIEKTIDALEFETSFYHEGNLLTTEAYKYLPVKVHVLDEKAKGNQFYFEILNGQQFRLSSGSSAKVEENKVFHFMDTIQFNGLNLVVELTKKVNVDEFTKERFLFSYTPVSQLTGSYVSKLNASWAEEGAGVINLAVNGSDYVKNIDFLRGLIKQYQEYDLDKKNQAALRTIDFIGDQLLGISDSLRKAERQLEVFKNANVLTDLGAEASRLYEKVEALELQKTELIIRKSYYKYLSDYISHGKGLDQIILPSSLGIEDVILSGLISDMVENQNQLKLFTGKGNATNPLVEGKINRVEEIKLNIIESIKNQESVDQIKLDFLNKGINDVQKHLDHLPAAERQLVSIQRNYSLLENLYIFLLQKKAEAGISRASTTTDIIEVNPPMLAGAAISPQTSRNYLIALVLGLSVPILFFVILELFNSQVQSREDIEKITAIPFIGGIGHKKGNLNLEVLTSPKSAISESFRALRSNLNYFTTKKEKTIFLVTSSISGEGKTFTSINLASIMALSGKRTLLVGADLRRPKIYADFNLSNEEGLSNFLAGLSDFTSVVQHTMNDNLDLVSGGPVPPNPSELLMSTKMEEFLEKAKEHYDCIIIDTPPLAIVTDAFVLSPYADHTLFLIRQNFTPKTLIRTINEFYINGKLKNISIVFNDIYKSGPGYGYGYGYGHGYGYGYGYTGKSKDGYGYYSQD